MSNTLIYKRILTNSYVIVNYGQLMEGKSIVLDYIFIVIEKKQQ